MMGSLSIEQVQAKLPELVHGLGPGDEVVILDHDHPIARIVPVTEPVPRPPRHPGTLRGSVLYMAPDFDAPLDDFKEYMG